MSLQVILPPTNCPECGTDITTYTEPKSAIETHWCENTLCRGRVREMLTFIADRTLLEIDGLGPELADALARGSYVTDLADLFEFGNEAAAALDRMGEDKFSELMRKRGLPGAATISMVTSLERAKTARWDRWIAALGIPLIGLQLGKVLARERNLGPEDMLSLPLKLSMPEAPEAKEIEGIGFHKKAELNRFSLDEKEKRLCLRLYQAGVRPAPVEQPMVSAGSPLAGMAFCITGEMYGIGSRDYLTRELVKLGAVSKSGVTKKVTHLLVGTEPGRSKLAKAAELKIPKLDEDWVSATFEKYGVKTSGASLMVEWGE